MRRHLAALVTLALMPFAMAACGGDGESEEGEGERTTVACSGTPVTTTDLPGDFPDVDGVTYTDAATAGPSQIVDGYYEGSLEDAYEAYKAAFPDAGYEVLFDELEENDSEVAWKGGRRTGIVALRANCEESGRVSVHITSRPQ